MAKLQILWVPDPILKTKCTPVRDIDDAVRGFLDDMLQTMYAAPGIGLAAPQVGRAERMLVLDVSDDRSKPLKMINPEIVDVSDHDAVYEEGCLSVPEHYAEVTRPDWVKVSYMDENAHACTVTAEGLLATCLQHEIDHLDGIVFLDHLSSLKRNMIVRKMIKAKKVADRDAAA
jgi:peptide deformylase